MLRCTDLISISTFLKAPNGLAILSRTFPDGDARNKALAIYTACAPLGSTIGTVVGSLLSCMSYSPSSPAIEFSDWKIFSV